MNHATRIELANHIIGSISDGVIDDENHDEWHNALFNESYYIIGRYDAEKWLTETTDGIFNTIGEIVEYETENFEKVTTDVTEPERVVNMAVYIWGEQLLGELAADTVDELEELCKEISE